MFTSLLGRDQLKQRVSSTRAALSSILVHKTQYQYLPLQKSQIRLLGLYPGEHGAQIRCTLRAVDLLAYDDVAAESAIEGWERFDAISYVWGDRSRKVEILCDDLSARITVNLADALQRFRDPVQTRVLWADALCINQKDNDERAEQVKLMGLIYFKAHKVRIWLGRDDEVREPYRARNAAQVIIKYASLYETCCPDPTGEKVELCSKNLFKKPWSTHYAHWKALRDLLGRPWFTRVWVVQELGLSRDAVFYCGDSQFNKLELYYFECVLLSSKTGTKIWRSLDMQMMNLGEDYYRSTWSNARFELGEDPMRAETFFDILRAARGLQCTDPRDMIYAFLGHPSAFKRQLLDGDPYHWYPRNYYAGRPTIVSPNYHRSNTFPKLCKDLAITAIQDFDIGLNLLSHVAHDHDTIDMKIPSWVPRWDLMRAPSQFFGSRIYYAASGSLPSTKLSLAKLSSSRKVPSLSLRALRLGKISFAFSEPTVAPPEIVADYMAQLLGDIPRRGATSRIAPPSLTSYFYDDNFLLALGVTMTAGLTSGRNFECRFPAHDHESHHLNIFRAYYRQQQALVAGARPDPEDEEDADYFSKDYTYSAACRALFLTFEGQFGLGPAISDARDEIWLPMGARMPFVFRPTKTGAFRVVGQAYLHEAMRGEAVEGKGEEDFETVTLE